MIEVLDTLTPEDKRRWRLACARLEVAQSPPRDMGKDDCIQAWVDYYAMTDELHERYEVAEDERTLISIMPSSGRIIVEEE